MSMTDIMDMWCGAGIAIGMLIRSVRLDLR